MRLLIAPLMLTLSLAACAPAQTQSPAARPAAMAALPSNPDALFMMAVSMTNHFEIESSQAALTKSSRADVREYAQRMITEHTNAERQLAQMAAARNVPLPGQPGPDQRLKIMYASQLSGPNFDAVYLANQIVGHESAVALLQSEIGAGRDPQAVAMARQMLPIIQDHLAHARRLAGTGNPQ